MRTIIDMPDEMIKTLDQMSGEEKRSRAALIREAVSLYLKEKKHPSMEAAFGVWKKTNVDGVQYQRKLRREWEDA